MKRIFLKALFAIWTIVCLPILLIYPVTYCYWCVEEMLYTVAYEKGGD